MQQYHSMLSCSNSLISRVIKSTKIAVPTTGTIFGPPQWLASCWSNMRECIFFDTTSVTVRWRTPCACTGCRPYMDPKMLRRRSFCTATRCACRANSTKRSPTKPLYPNRELRRFSRALLADGGACCYYPEVRGVE